MLINLIPVQCRLIAELIAGLVIAAVIAAGGWHARAIIAERDEANLRGELQTQVIAAQAKAAAAQAKGEQVATDTQSAIDAMRQVLQAQNRVTANVLSKIPRDCGVGADGLRNLTDAINSVNGASSPAVEPGNTVPTAQPARKRLGW